MHLQNTHRVEYNLQNTFNNLYLIPYYQRTTVDVPTHILKTNGIVGRLECFRVCLLYCGLCVLQVTLVYVVLVPHLFDSLVEELDLHKGGVGPTGSLSSLVGDLLEVGLCGCYVFCSAIDGHLRGSLCGVDAVESSHDLLRHV